MCEVDGGRLRVAAALAVLEAGDSTGGRHKAADGRVKVCLVQGVKGKGCQTCTDQGNIVCVRVRRLLNQAH